MAEYAKRFEGGEPVTCDNCGYPAALGDFTPLQVPPSTKAHLYCEVCAKTFLSVATDYPSQCPDSKLYQAVGWVANKILEEIEKIKTDLGIGKTT